MISGAPWSILNAVTTEQMAFLLRLRSNFIIYGTVASSTAFNPFLPVVDPIPIASFLVREGAIEAIQAFAEREYILIFMEALNGKIGFTCAWNVLATATYGEKMLSLHIYSAFSISLLIF